MNSDSCNKIKDNNKIYHSSVVDNNKGNLYNKINRYNSYIISYSRYNFLNIYIIFFSTEIIDENENIISNKSFDKFDKSSNDASSCKY